MPNPAGEGIAGVHGAPPSPAQLGQSRGWIMNACHTVAKAVTAIALIAELVVVVLDVTGRSLFSHSFLWSDEAAKLALSVITFVGGAVAYREGRHAAINLLVDQLPARSREIVFAAIEWIVVIVCSVTAWVSLELLEAHWGDFTPMLQISTAWYFLPLTAGVALIAIYGIERLILRHSLVTIVSVGAVAILLAVLLTYSAPVKYMVQHPGLALGGMIALFFSTVLMGLPVSFAMLLATLTYLLVTDTAPPVAAPQNMLDGTSNFILLALPFFLFAGVRAGTWRHRRAAGAFRARAGGTSQGRPAPGHRRHDLPRQRNFGLQGCGRGSGGGGGAR